MSIVNEVRKAVWEKNGQEFFSNEIIISKGYTLSRKQKAIYHLVESGELKKKKIPGKNFNYVYKATPLLRPSDYNGAQVAGKKAKVKDSEPLAGWVTYFPQYFTRPDGFRVIGQTVVKHLV